LNDSFEPKSAPETKAPTPSISVIVCAYSNERIPQLRETLASLQEQTYPAKDIVLIIDHNPELKREFEGLADGQLRVAANSGERGLASARNTGIELAEGELMAFIDDDAAAESTWLERLVECYRDPDVIAAGGRIEPVWEGGRKPAWLPEEFLWVVGCSYRGMAEGSIRNMIGCNMSFRSSVFEEVGAFNPGIGRLGNQPLGCEETEICIRALERWPGKRIMYVPEALVHHHASRSRQTISYFAKRCYFEGVSKVVVRRLRGASGTSSEVGYLSRALPMAVLRDAQNAVLLRGTGSSLSRIGMVTLGVGAVGAGFAYGLIQQRRK
jgi:GT2 family glycosyltransferase